MSHRFLNQHIGIHERTVRENLQALQTSQPHCWVTHTHMHSKKSGHTQKKSLCNVSLSNPETSKLFHAFPLLFPPHTYRFSCALYSVAMELDVGHHIPVRSTVQRAFRSIPALHLQVADIGPCNEHSNNQNDLNCLHMFCQISLRFKSGRERPEISATQWPRSFQMNKCENMRKL